MVAARRIPASTRPRPWAAQPAAPAVPTDAAGLIAYLYRAGVRLTTDGTRLVLDAPKGVLTDAVMEAVDAHLEDIARYAVAVDDLGQTTCPRCGSQDLYYLTDQQDRHFRCERCQPKALLGPPPAGGRRRA